MPVVFPTASPVLTFLEALLWKFSATFVTASALFLLSSCARFDPPERSVADANVPESFSLYGPVEAAPDTWWETFESEELNRLVDEALAGNLTLAQAVARIQQAGAVARQAGAPLQPTLSYGADTSISRRRTEIGGGESGVDAATRRLNALNSLLSAATGGGRGRWRRSLAAGCPSRCPGEQCRGGALDAVARYGGNRRYG